MLAVPGDAAIPVSVFAESAAGANLEHPVPASITTIKKRRQSN
jgi:hypothetical protein